MGGVGDELAHLRFGAFLVREGVLDLRQHDVDGVREHGDLAAFLTGRHAAGQVACGDSVGSMLDTPQWAQMVANRQPGDSSSRGNNG